MFLCCIKTGIQEGLQVADLAFIVKNKNYR